MKKINLRFACLNTCAKKNVNWESNSPQSPVSNWENGKTLPDIVSVIRMSELYKVSLDELIKGDKMMMEKIEKDTFAIQREKKIIRFAWISIALGIIMLVIGNVFDGNPVIDFIEGALPWMLLALTILFEILYLNKEDRK